MAGTGLAVKQPADEVAGTGLAAKQPADEVAGTGLAATQPADEVAGTGLAVNSWQMNDRHRPCSNSQQSKLAGTLP